MRARREGFAIFIVLIVALLLGGLATILWTSGGGSAAATTEQSFEKYQAEFLAKGAQQHALLKCRLLPTELYDAVSYSIGRNPYYDFGLGLKAPLDDPNTISGVDASRAPGPMFYTGQNTIRLKPDPPDGTTPSRILVDRSGNVSEGTGYEDRMYLPLAMFTFDISTLFPDPSSPANSVVVVDSASHPDKAFGNEEWRDPFIGNYKVQTLRILGLQGGRRYDRDTMLLTTVGSVKRSGQISLVTNLNGSPKGLSPTRRVSREADEGFGEFSTRFEDMEEFNDRVGDGTADTNNEDVFTAQASGRRTEIATGVYYITRKAFGGGPP